LLNGILKKNQYYSQLVLIKILKCLTQGLMDNVLIFILACQNNKFKSDIECAIWDPVNPVRIVFSCEDGSIGMIDARKFDKDFVFH